MLTAAQNLRFSRRIIIIIIRVSVEINVICFIWWQESPQSFVYFAHETDKLFLLLFLNFFHIMPTHAARRQEIIKMTEQLIEAINNGDFDAYTWVDYSVSLRSLHLNTNEQYYILQKNMWSTCNRIWAWIARQFGWRHGLPQVLFWKR